MEEIKPCEHDWGIYRAVVIAPKSEDLFTEYVCFKCQEKKMVRKKGNPMPEQLKPCPFCGEEGRLINIDGQDEKGVACSSPHCLAEAFTVFQWNTRANKEQ